MRVLTRTRRLTAELHARRAWFARPAPQCGATSGALELHTFAHSMSKLELGLAIDCQSIDRSDLPARLALESIVTFHRQRSYK